MGCELLCFRGSYSGSNPCCSCSPRATSHVTRDCARAPARRTRLFLFTSCNSGVVHECVRSLASCRTAFGLRRPQVVAVHPGRARSPLEAGWAAEPFPLAGRWATFAPRAKAEEAVRPAFLPTHCTVQCTVLTTFWKFLCKLYMFRTEKCENTHEHSTTNYSFSYH